MFGCTPCNTIVFVCSFPADLGGQLGLFLGASIMTLVEFMDLICHLTVLAMGGRSHVRKSQVNLTTATSNQQVTMTCDKSDSSHQDANQITLVNS